MKRTGAIAGLVLACLVLASCSATEKPATSAAGPVEPPPIYDVQLVDRYAALSDSGYTLLDDGKVDEAIAIFTEQSQLIPEGRGGLYNLACAHGRAGHVEEGMVALTTAVEQGWSDPEQLEYDSDLDALREDPRFAGLQTQAEETLKLRTAAFAYGLPEPVGEIPVVPDADSLDAWLAAERSKTGSHRRVWHPWQQVAAKLHLQSRRLAALAQLKRDDPEFDLGLERIRTLSSVYSMWDSWGPLTDGVLHEVDRYLAGDPSPEGGSEAHYRAATALFLRQTPRDATDDDWSETSSAIRAHLAEVEPPSELAGSAAAIGLIVDLLDAGPERGELIPRVREFWTEYGTDEKAERLAARFFQEDLLQAQWPISIQSIDLDGEPVSLDQYDGKVLLIDFWATWCGPCRGELPHLREAYERFAAEGFEILSISLDYATRKSPEEYRAWIDENGMTWRHVYDGQDWKGPLVKAFHVRSIPSPVLVGRDGKIIASGDACRGEQLLDAIEQALKEESA